MAIDTSTRFGVVYSTPKDFIEKISSKDSAYTNGKLFVLHGDAQGALTQGIYMVEQNDADPDGSLNIQMLSSGTYASSTNAGLMSAADVEKLAGTLSKTDASNTYLKINDASFFRTVTVKNGNTTTNIVADSSRDTLTITAGSNIKLTGNASNDTLTIEATDTIYTGTTPINVNGTVISHANSGVTAGGYGDTSSARTLEFGGKFKVVDVSVNALGHVTKAASYELTLPSKPATAGTADEAKKTTGTLTIKGNGTSVGTFNGSAAEEVNIKTGNASTLTVTGTTDGSITITPQTAAVASNSNALTTGAQVASYVSAELGKLSGALIYKDTITSYGDLPTASTSNTGHVYICSSTFTTTTAQTGVEYHIEVGDMFISNGEKWNIVSSEFDVSANSNGTALTVGSTKTIATVDGVDIKVSLPAKGDNVYYEHPAAINGAVAVSSSDGGDFTFSTSAKTLQVITGAHRDSSGHISKLIYKDITLPAEAYSDTVYVHPVSISGTILADSSLKSTTATPVSHEGTFTVATGVYRDASGHVSKVATETFKLPAQYVHPVVGTTNTQTDTSVLTAVTLNSSTKFTVVNGVYRDASGHVNKVTTTQYTMPASAFNDTKCTSLTLNVDSSADVPTALYADVISNTKITASGSGTGLTGTMTSVRVATQAAVEAAQAAATIYWETL